MGFTPFCARQYAHVMPVIPPPIMSTSVSRLFGRDEYPILFAVMFQKDKVF
jgi:hypothetical protein